MMMAVIAERSATPSLVDRHSLTNPRSQCCLNGGGNEARPVEVQPSKELCLDDAE